ncbi:MAG: hypothetical protein ACI9OJ_004038 [Myxococcota bacterium]|jgi:hypothetical protein
MTSAVPQVTLRDLVAGIVAELGESQAAAALEAGVDQMFPDAPTATAVKAQVAAYLADPNIEAFPSLPLNLADTAQGFFEAEEVAPPAPAVMHFNVEAILTQGCTAARSELKPVDARIPGLTTGSVADYRFDDCAVQRAQDFAAVLNNLSLENGSSVTYQDQKFETIESAVRVLVAAGHEITVTNDRFFANFLGLFYNGAAVIAPVWLTTDLSDGQGGQLALPSPHTHHTIVVSGPLINITLMYYMGVSGGVSFRAVANERAPWTGRRIFRTYKASTDLETVVTLLVTGGELRQRWADEGAALPALGYGTLGVCNDSTAVMECAVEGYEAAEALGRIFKTLPLENLDDLPFPVLSGKLKGLTGQ